ncbi:hypothetical protein GUJ93_ZPchr0008g13444 [Zizania palustris]|uniref:Uncharacterized protein n=1 Tax=Zizania palustris TaxID=103762 RepID=A0A8J5R044_ZIZPA|nr:hypothetical protein GUJ93_ZPchr0008g13444 [Zizania palustris]
MKPRLPEPLHPQPLASHSLPRPESPDPASRRPEPPVEPPEATPSHPAARRNLEPPRATPRALCCSEPPTVRSNPVA